MTAEHPTHKKGDIVDIRPVIYIGKDGVFVVQHDISSDLNIATGSYAEVIKEDSNLIIEAKDILTVKEAFEFVEWVGKYYIRLEKIWCNKFQDQRDPNNYANTEELYKRWVFQKEAFSQAQKDYG